MGSTKTTKHRGQRSVRGAADTCQHMYVCTHRHTSTHVCAHTETHQDMYVCMHHHVYACTHRDTSTHNMHAHRHITTYMRVHRHIRTCMGAKTHINTHAQTGIHQDTYGCTYQHITLEHFGMLKSAHVGTHQHIHMCTHRHTSTHTCVHTLRHIRSCKCAHRSTRVRTEAHIRTCMCTHTCVHTRVVCCWSWVLAAHVDAYVHREWPQLTPGPGWCHHPSSWPLPSTDMTLDCRKWWVFLSGPAGQETQITLLAARSEDTRHFCVGVRGIFKQFPWKKKLLTSCDHTRQVLCMSPVA